MRKNRYIEICATPIFPGLRHPYPQLSIEAMWVSSPGRLRAIRISHWHQYFMNLGLSIESISASNLHFSRWDTRSGNEMVSRVAK